MKVSILSHPPFCKHVLTRKMETSGGDCAAAVQHSVSRLATGTSISRGSRALIGVHLLLLSLLIFILSFSRSSRPLLVLPSHPPILLEHRSRLSDQPEPTLSPLQHFLYPLELLLAFVFIYFTCTIHSHTTSNHPGASQLTYILPAPHLTPIPSLHKIFPTSHLRTLL